MDKKDDKLSKENPEKMTRGQRADQEDESWVIITNERCPLCGERLSARESDYGIEYLFCTNYPCKYVKG